MNGRVRRSSELYQKKVTASKVIPNARSSAPSPANSTGSSATFMEMINTPESSTSTDYDGEFFARTPNCEVRNGNASQARRGLEMDSQSAVV